MVPVCPDVFLNPGTCGIRVGRYDHKWGVGFSGIVDPCCQDLTPPPKTKKTPLFQLPWTLSRRCDRLRDMAQPRPAKTYPLKAEQFAPEKLPKPNSEVYASNHGLFRGELLNFGSVFVFFLVNIRWTDFFPANFLKFISSIQQFLVAWNCLGWVGWFMDSPRHPWTSAVVVFCFWLFWSRKKLVQNESCLAMGMMSKGFLAKLYKWENQRDVVQ